MLSYQHSNEIIPFRNDFLLTALILIAGFFLVALTSTSYVEKKINKSLSSIKNILLQIVVGDDIPKRVLEKTPKDIAQMFLQIKQQIVDREKLLNQKAKTNIQKEKMEALSHLSASAAHEINNPLAAILGHAQIAKGKAQDFALHNHLNIIEKEIRKIKEFVKNLMKFSNDAPTDYTPLNIKKIILESIDLMQHELAGKGIQIKKELLSTQEIYGDANKLQQIFINLINNAIFAMEKSPQKVLSIHTQDVNDSVRIEVKDTGIGMPPDIQEKILEPFFTTKADGKGLGLSISFGIIKGHGGHFSVDSKPQQGTCFTIDLPCQISTKVIGTQPDENVIPQDISEKSVDSPSHIPKIQHHEDITEDTVDQVKDIEQIVDIPKYPAQKDIKSKEVENEEIEIKNEDEQEWIENLKKERIPELHFLIKKDSIVKAEMLKFKMDIRSAKITTQSIESK